MSWNKVELTSICDVFSDGDWIESKDQSENGIRLIQTGNVGFGKFKARDSKARYISEETFKRLRCTEIKQGDIIISRLPDPVGRACVIPELDVKSITAVDCTIVRAKNEIISTEFLNYFCQSPQYFQQVNKNITGATRQRISRSLLGKTEIPLPPLTTQKKIVSKLDAIFSEIDKATAAVEANAKNAETLFQSYLRQVFEGDSDWKKSTIGEALSVIKNGVNCQQNKVPIGNKITRIETIAKKKFDFERVGYATLTEDEKERAKLIVGDILFSHINSPIHVGKTAIYEAEEEIYHGINLLLMRTTKDINPYFFNYFLNQLFASGYWEKNCKKSVNQASVNQKDISKVEFKFPNLDIQDKTVARLDSLLEVVNIAKESYKDKVTELVNLKKSILKQAFAGELVKE